MKNDIFITYRHFRLFKNDGEISPTGGATVAFFVDLRDPNDRKAFIGWAICSDNDHFCKNTGRAVAYRRLQDNRRMAKQWLVGSCDFVVGEKETDGTLCAQMLKMFEDQSHLLAHEEFYQWLKNHWIIS